MRIRERVLDLNEELAGNRLLMGFLALGGVRQDIDVNLRRRLERELPELKRDLLSIMDVLLHSESVLDRLETTGIVRPEVAKDLGLVGPVARSAGVDVDVRRDHPYAAYRLLAFEVPTRTKGDALSRVKVKADEFVQSVGLIEQALQLMPRGPLRGRLGEAVPGSWAFEATESARGENIHFVMAGENGTVYRHKVRTSSYMNWPAVPLAVLGNIVPDFPVINKSFNLCYACCDR
jgi:Ni,Fe-hydrogenase III large subunit